MPASNPPLAVNTRIFYGIGSIAEGVKETAFNVFLLFYYNQVLGLSGSLVGLALFIALLIDAISDPLVGVLSDRTRSRLGRRHPYMFAAAVPVGLCFYLLFAPPTTLQPMQLFGWLLGFTVLLRLSLTLYAVPSNALAAELSRDYDERTEILGIRFLFGWLAGLGSAIMGFVWFFAPRPDGSDGRLMASAYPEYGLTAGLLCSIAILLCAGGTPQSRNRDNNGPAPGLLSDLRVVWQNDSFRALLSSVLFSACAWGYVNAVGYYVNTYYWGLSSDDLGVLTLGMLIAVILAASLTPWLGSHWDKRHSALGLGIFALLLGPLPILLRELGAMPAVGSRDLLTVLFFFTLVLTTVIIALNILCASMLADLTDQGEADSGRRLEGAFSALLVFALKASTALGALLAGLSLDWLDFPGMAEQSAVPAAAARRLAIGYAPAIMLLYAVSLIGLYRYRLSRQAHQALLLELPR